MFSPYPSPISFSDTGLEKTEADNYYAVIQNMMTLLVT